MGLYPSNRTFGELLRAVQRGFGDESGVQLEDQDVVDFANQGLMDIVSENGVLKARSTTPSTIGQREYTFPESQIARVEYIHYAGRMLPNMPFQEAQTKLGDFDPLQERTGTPQWWYSYGDTFWLWPTPTESAPVELFYVRYPTPLTSDPNQPIGVPDKWFNPLVAYVLTRAYEMDQDWQAAQVKDEQYKAALASQSEEESQQQWGAFPVIREV
jgi:hypothetical protein